MCIQIFIARYKVIFQTNLIDTFLSRDIEGLSFSWAWILKTKM